MIKQRPEHDKTDDGTRDTPNRRTALRLLVLTSECACTADNQSSVDKKTHRRIQQGINGGMVPKDVLQKTEQKPPRVLRLLDEVTESHANLRTVRQSVPNIWTGCDDVKGTCGKKSEAEQRPWNLTDYHPPQLQ